MYGGSVRKAGNWIRELESGTLAYNNNNNNKRVMKSRSRHCVLFRWWMRCHIILPVQNFGYLQDLSCGTESSWLKIRFVWFLRMDCIRRFLGSVIDLLFASFLPVLTHTHIFLSFAFDWWKTEAPYVFARCRVRSRFRSISFGFSPWNVWASNGDTAFHPYRIPVTIGGGWRIAWFRCNFDLLSQLLFSLFQDQRNDKAPHSNKHHED